MCRGRFWIWSVPSCLSLAFILALGVGRGSTRAVFLRRRLGSRSAVFVPLGWSSSGLRMRRSSSRPSVPGRFRCSFSGGVPFGARGPVLPVRFPPLRWLVLCAARAYLAAVCRAQPVRQAVAWRLLCVFAPAAFARSFAWWVRQVTEPVAA
jgi:hypothetical protein